MSVAAVPAPKVGFRRIISRSAKFLALGFAVMFALLAIVLPKLPSAQLDVRIDMFASAGSSVSLYLNTLDVPPQTEPLIVGVRHTYVFPAPRGAITRITPILATEAGVLVRVYSISVTEGRRVVATFTAADLSNWAHYFFGPTTVTPNYIQLTSNAPSASIDAFQTVAEKDDLPFPLDVLEADSTEATGRLQLSLFAAGGLLLLLLLLGRTSRVFAAAVGIDTLIVVDALHLLLAQPVPLAPVTEAIGNAVYYGRSAAVDVHALIESALLAAALGIATSAIYRRRFPKLQTQSIETGATEPGSGTLDFVDDERAQRLRRLVRALWTVRPIWWVTCATLIVGLAAFLPNVINGINAAKTQQFVENWDGDNLLVWTALAARSLVPMKNFWYPYGNELFFQANLLWGPVALFAYQMLSFAGFSAIFWKLSGRRVVVTSGALVALVLIIPFLGEYARYGVSMSIAVTFVALRFTPIGRGRTGLRILFALLFGSALFTELDVAGYGAVGVICVVIVSGAAFSTGIRQWVKLLALDLAGAAATVVFWVVVTALRGQLPGELHFYLHPGTLTAYSAAAAQMSLPLDGILNLNNVVVWAPVAALAIAIAFRFWGVRTPLLPTAVIALVGAAGPLLDKDAVRAVTGDLYLPFLLATLCTLVSLTNWAMSGRGRLASLIVGAMCGAIYASGAASGEWDALWVGFKATPRLIASDVATVLSPPADLASVQARRFDIEHFSNYTDVLAIERVLAPLVKGRHNDLYVLGDAQTLYLMLDQQVPWEINLYNSSPIEDQLHVVTWIKDHRPRYVVLDGRYGESFDGVPNSVRVPFLYQEVIKHYAFVRSVGQFDVLERTDAAPRKSASFWASRLGNTIALGSVVESIPESGPTVASSGHALLRVTVANPSGNTVTIPLEFGRTLESISFTTEPGRHQYEVPLNRLWTWALSTQVHVETTPNGVAAVVERGSISRSELY